MRRRSAPILVVVCLALASGLATSRSDAASSASIVGAQVLSATQVDLTGCSAGAARSFGAIAVATTSITGTDCTVGFGASNAASSLRVVQSDEGGTAMTQWDPAGVVDNGAPKLQGAEAISATEAWVVGEAVKTGAQTPLARTTDGGVTWTDQAPCTAGARLNAISHVTGSALVTVGFSNVICRTTDSGATWTSAGATPNSHWYAVDFLPSGEGWAVGSTGRVIRSTDSGATWTSLPSPNTGWLLAGIDAVSSTHLYAVAYGSTFPRPVYALASQDGGATWNSTLIGNVQHSGSGRAVAATSASTAFVGTSYGLHRTTDSGATWTQVHTSQPSCMTATGPTNVVAYTHSGIPQRTADDGATWTPATAPPTITGYLRGCASGAAGTVFVAGYNDQRLRSPDHGDTYVASASTYRNQHGAAAWDASHAVTVGDNGSIRRTTDSGTTFTAPASGTTAALRSVVAFDHAGDRVAVATGAAGVLRRSSDGGATWSAVTSGTAAAIEQVAVSQDGTLVAVGATGLVLRSFDAGVSWHELPAPAAIALNDVHVGSPRDIWVVGAGGAAYRTADGGATWQSQVTGTALAITGLDSLDGQNALAVTALDGSNQSGVLRTVDGGATWTVTMTIGPDSHPSFDVRWLDATRAVIGDIAGYRLSTDGGITWTEQSSNLTQVYAIERLDTHAFIAAGQNELIGRVLPAVDLPDFALATNDFTTSTGAFGACLHAATGTSSTAWPVAGAGNCTTAQLGNWRPIAASTPASNLAARATSGTASVDLRFGVRPANAQATGAYAADIRFEVVAP